MDDLTKFPVCILERSNNNLCVWFGNYFSLMGSDFIMSRTGSNSPTLCQ